MHIRGRIAGRILLPSSFSLFVSELGLDGMYLDPQGYSYCPCGFRFGLKTRLWFPWGLDGGYLLISSISAKVTTFAVILMVWTCCRFRPSMLMVIG